MSRLEIITIARTWLGTPYHHQARTKNIGTDCLGLVLGVYQEVVGGMPVNVPNYSPDWAEASGIETMLYGARDHLEEIPPDNAHPGDVAVFRLRNSVVAKHAAILMPDNKMIHAMEGTAVSEVYFTPWWQRRVAATFKFPGVI